MQNDKGGKKLKKRFNLDEILLLMGNHLNGLLEHGILAEGNIGEEPRKRAKRERAGDQI